MAMMRAPALRSWMLALTVAALAGSGCKLLDRQPLTLPPECCSACHELPCDCRGQVYVFLISGIDPLDTCRIREFRSELIRAGFNNIYNGHGYHDTLFAGEMHRIALEEPGAHFVVVGFSSGSDFAVSLAESVGNYGIKIDLLASIDPPFWSSAASKKPGNVMQTTHIHGQPMLWPVRSSYGDEIVIETGLFEDAADQSATVEHLTRMLAGIAGSVPISPAAAPMPMLANDGPRPRQFATQTDRPHDAWDFLKPVAKLRTNPVDESNRSAERTTLRPLQPAPPE